MACKRAKIGQMFKGQAWVALHGDFTIAELQAILERVKELCEGVPRPNDNTELHNS